MLSPAETMCFWTGIMREHAEIFLISLSSREGDMINTAQNFKKTFTKLHNEANTALKNNTEVIELTKSSDLVVIKYIEFKKLLLRKLLKCEIEINLTPTFINHTINEALEFKRDIMLIQKGELTDPIKENIMLHKIWLPDAAGHAATIASELDPVEAEFIEKARNFKKDFNNLHLKALELGLQLDRSCLENGALQWFNLEVSIKMNEFIYYLDKVRELRERCKLLSPLPPFVPDHMIREERYYIRKVESLL